MSGLRDLIQANGPLVLAAGGALIGAAFGAVVYATNFCTMGALSDVVNLGDWRRLRAWLLAAATALAGAQILEALGVVDLRQSMYLSPNFNWAGNLAGGLMFGFGMVFAGGCASRNLARAGGGDLRALMTLIVLGLVAYMTIGGILAPARTWLEQATSLALKLPTQSVGDVLAALTGLPVVAAKSCVSIGLVVAVLLYCFKDREFRSSPVHVGSAFGVGLAVVAGWALTGLAFDELATRPTQPVSLTFVRPAGDALEWLSRYTASPIPGFGAATVFGTLAGAFAAARWMGRFRFSTFSDTTDTLRSLMGASLMGIGGVLALGCTIGQAVTGVSTLAIGSFLTFAAIVAGGICGLKTLERWLSADV